MPAEHAGAHCEGWKSREAGCERTARALPPSLPNPGLAPRQRLFCEVNSAACQPGTGPCNTAVQCEPPSQRLPDRNTVGTSSERPSRTHKWLGLSHRAFYVALLKGLLTRPRLLAIGPTFSLVGHASYSEPGLWISSRVQVCPGESRRRFTTAVTGWLPEPVSNENVPHLQSQESEAPSGKVWMSRTEPAAEERGGSGTKVDRLGKARSVGWARKNVAEWGLTFFLSSFLSPPFPSSLPAPFTPPPPPGPQGRASLGKSLS